MNRFLRLMLLNSAACFAAPDEGQGGGDPPPVNPQQQAIDGMYPNEEGGDKQANPAAGDEGNGEDDGAGGEWKEYVDDPNKTAEENAAAKAEHDKSKPADDKADLDKVPEDGKYKLTMPEGVELDTELADALGGEFKELGLTHAQAQKLTDKYIATIEKRETARGENWAKTINGWMDQAKADPEIGGPKWDQTTKDAVRAVNKLGTPALKEYLAATGGGNHPELIRVFAKVGTMIKEDDPAAHDSHGKPVKADAATILYPNDLPKG